MSFVALQNGASRGHVGGLGESVGRDFGQHLVQNGGQLARDVGQSVFQRRDGLLHVGGHLVERALVLAGFERGDAGEELIKRAAQAVDVGADIDGMTVGGLLRGHVIGGAHRLAGMGHVGKKGDRHLIAFGASPLFSRPLFRLFLPEWNRQPEVENLHGALRREHEVRRFYIAMDKSLLVDVLQSDGRMAGELAASATGSGPRRRTSCPRSMPSTNSMISTGGTPALSRAS